MGMPYRARINERTLLNLPGYHGGAFVYAYVEDTSDRDLVRNQYCEADCDCCPQNFEPRVIVEIADCDRTIGLTFDIDKPDGRENSLLKLDTLVAALQVFGAALIEEFEPYDARQRVYEALCE
jgi:hypothetical protein